MFIIIETQKNAEGIVAVVTPSVIDDREQAEAAYHSALAAAAVSKVPVHAVTMQDEYGDQLKKECYLHA